MTPLTRRIHRLEARQRQQQAAQCSFEGYEQMSAAERVLAWEQALRAFLESQLEAFAASLAALEAQGQWERT